MSHRILIDKLHIQLFCANTRHFNIEIYRNMQFTRITRNRGGISLCSNFSVDCTIYTLWAQNQIFDDNIMKYEFEF